MDTPLDASHPLSAPENESDTTSLPLKRARSEATPELDARNAPVSTSFIFNDLKSNFVSFDSLQALFASIEPSALHHEIFLIWLSYYHAPSYRNTDHYLPLHPALEANRDSSTHKIVSYVIDGKRYRCDNVEFLFSCFVDGYCIRVHAPNLDPFYLPRFDISGGLFLTRMAARKLATGVTGDQREFLLRVCHLMSTLVGRTTQSMLPTIANAALSLLLPAITTGFSTFLEATNVTEIAMIQSNLFSLLQQTFTEGTFWGGFVSALLALSQHCEDQNSRWESFVSIIRSRVNVKGVVAQAANLFKLHLPATRTAVDGIVYHDKSALEAKPVLALSETDTVLLGTAIAPGQSVAQQLFSPLTEVYVLNPAKALLKRVKKGRTDTYAPLDLTQTGLLTANGKTIQAFYLVNMPQGPAATSSANIVATYEECL